MKRIFVALLALSITFVLTSCKNHTQDIASSSAPEHLTTKNTYPETSPANNTLSESSSSSVVSASATVKTSITKTSRSDSLCNHEKYWKNDDDLHFIGGWYERQPGVENRFTLHAACTEKQQVVYKCPQCLEPVLYEELEPLGHNFSEEEEVILYPNVNNEGSYGKRCKRLLCQSTLLTTPIPKRMGNYSSIDSCFSVNIGHDQKEYYHMDNPEVYISDARTWGSVPTIKYVPDSLAVSIMIVDQQGTPVTYSTTVDSELISQGYWLSITILETGTFESRYSRLAFSG